MNAPIVILTFAEALILEGVSCVANTRIVSICVAAISIASTRVRGNGTLVGI